MNTTPETLTAPLILEHLGHDLEAERLGRDCYTYFKTVAAAITCRTCGDYVAVEWIEEDK